MDPSPADRETESQDPLLLSSDGAGQHPGGEASAGELTLPGDHATEGASTSLMLVEEVSDERDGSEPSLLASKSGPWVLHSPKESRASILELEQQRLAQGVQERRVEIEPDGYATDDGLKRVPEARGEARRRSICHSRTDGYLSDDEVRPKLKDIPEWTGKAAWFPHRSAGAHGGRVSTELSATKGMAVRDPFADILSHPSPAQAVSTTLSEVDALRKEMADRDEAAVKSAATLEAQLSAVMTMIQHLNARGGATPVQNDGEAPSAATNSHTTGGAQPSAVARSDGNEGNTTDSESVAESSDESIVDGKCPKKKVDVRALGKPVEAPKYSGEDDWPCTLIDWAQNIQGMLLVANLDGDSLRAGLHMGSYMSGRASHLFSREILPELNAHHKSGKRKSKSPWPFDRIVLLLRERFVSESAVRDAQQHWRTLSQRRKDGSLMTVNDLAMRLEEYGEERQETTPHDFKLRFIDALIPDIAVKVMEHLDVDDVAVTFGDVIKRAVKCEQSWLQMRASREAERKGLTFSNYEERRLRLRHSQRAQQPRSESTVRPVCAAG